MCVCGSSLAATGKQFAADETCVAEGDVSGGGEIIEAEWFAHTLSLTLLTLHNFSKSKSRMWRLMLSI